MEKSKMEKEVYCFNSITDIIETAKKYKSERKNNNKNKNNNKKRKRVEYNSDLERLSECIEPLKKLNNLIGMDSLKKNIIDQLLFYTQELNTDEMMHTCLTGPPGVGKTTLGKILAELYCSMGFLETDNFKVVSKPELIAGYVGQTAIKTQKVLKSSLGGVLFIDEAYSLGSGEHDDSFGKECIDTINKFLSENTKNFVMVIAGYREELDHCFFSLNKGLRRRFPWSYDIDKYSIKDLIKIFVYQVIENDWDFDDTVSFDNYQKLDHYFEINKDIFEHNGGDTLVLFDKIKICHSRRVFGQRKKYKKVIDISDIQLGMELFKSFKKKAKKNEVPYGMYT